MHKTSLRFNISSPVKTGIGALFVTNGTYREHGRALDQHELIFIRRGCLHIEELGQSYEVKAGQAFIYAQGVHHSCYATGDEHLQQYWARFSCPEAEDDSDTPSIVVPRLATIARPDRMLHLWRMFTDEKRKEPLGQTSTDLLLTLMLCEVASSNEAARNEVDTLKVLAAQARAYIQENYHKPISRSSIALAIDCNPNYLGRAFNKAYGKTITEYIYDVRMFYAREKLACERITINEIARICGFGDRCHFRQVFVKREGLSPLAFRKRYGHPRTNL